MHFRSFGDFLLKSEMDKPPWKQVISPVPQIEQFKIDTSWEFLIVATDGVNKPIIIVQQHGIYPITPFSNKHEESDQRQNNLLKDTIFQKYFFAQI